MAWETLDIVRAITFAVFLIFVLYITITALWQLYDVLKAGQPDPERWGDWGKRFNVTMRGVFGQTKLLKNPAGFGHFVIFYGFIFVTIVSFEVFIRSFIPEFSLKALGVLYDILLWGEDILGVGVVIAIIVALVRRYVYKPMRFQEKLEHSGGLNRDATIILLVVGIHIILAQLLESIEIANNEFYGNAIPPVSGLLRGLWGPEPVVAEEIIWWLHVFSVWGFMLYIFGTNVRVPRFYPSKHFHILAAPVNVIFSNIQPRGRIRPMATSEEQFMELMEAAFEEDEENTTAFAVSEIDHLRWSDMMDLYSCTGCGRCQELCPAYLNEQPLSPKALILNMREELLVKASYEYKNKGETYQTDKALVGDIVPHETLWACTTCGACVDACPVFIDHVDKIVDMRRHLAMVETEFPKNVDTVFNNIETNSNPWGIGKADRDKWAADLDVKRMKDQPADWNGLLFWVGCAGSFDERAKTVATSLVKILRNADIDFAILGKEENCTGDPVRRMGNEYLALQLMTQNVQLLDSYNFKEIITFCPHCFNNLANELPDFGGHYRVIHAVDYVNRLIKEDKLKLNTTEPLSITYHDSCYLGRHNGIYSAPREILSQFNGITFVEMEMTGDKGLCCGAGGGRVWYELEEEPMAINKMRVQMAEATDAETIGVSCPFCTIMLEDGIKNLDSKLEVIDLLEIVANRLE